MVVYTVTKLSARLVGLTQPVAGLPFDTPEALVAYCARVSSDNQENPNYSRLLDYCIRNKHWSIFQLVNAVIEIEAPRDISRQFTRHSSLYCLDPFEAPGFNFDYGGVQEFSQRYSDDIEFTTREGRRQDNKNRQNSTDDLDKSDKDFFDSVVDSVIDCCEWDYKAARKRGIAKECARVFLPEGLTMSKLYVNGTLRSWLHYLDVRMANGTQKEHSALAYKIQEAIAPSFPTVFGLAK